MNAEEQLVMAEKILNTLESNRFEKWYEERFDDYITGWGEPPPSKEEILKDIIKLFSL